MVSSRIPLTGIGGGVEAMVLFKKGLPLSLNLPIVKALFMV